MKNLDIEIYMSKFKNFFDKNPEQLKRLIGDSNPDKFFEGIRTIVEYNSIQEDMDLEPTKKQIVDLILNLVSNNKISAYFEHHMGNICMN